MTLGFNPIITQVGLNAIANADGFELKIGSIGISDVGGNMSKLTTALPGQRNLEPIAGGKNLGNGQWHCTAVFFEDATYPVRGVSFYLENGVLFAYWTHPTNVLFYQTPLNKTVQAFDILLSSVPVNSITIDISGSLNLYYADVFMASALAQMKMSSAQISANLRQVSMYKKLTELGG
jgi:hypothetical protein